MIADHQDLFPILGQTPKPKLPKGKESDGYQSRIFPDIRTPIGANIELTTACNLNCRHCYNFFRHEPAPTGMMSFEQADRLLDEIVANKLFHTVLTGGEAMANFKVLAHFMRRLDENNVSLSMNSNLMLTTEERMEELASYGLPHILTSLNSHDPEVNDRMVSQEGAHAKILRGVRHAVKTGVRVSANMIVTQANKHHVYETGKLMAELGVTNMFTTRMIPSHVNAATCASIEKELQLTPGEEMELILDEAIRVKEDFGVQIGSLIQYPVCFLRDPVKYRDYVGRGCSAGRRMMAIHADGMVEACVHESVGYGNVYTDGIKKVWDNMAFWRDDSLLTEECLDCAWLKWCEGGCRVYANHLEGMDMLAQNPAGLPTPEEADSRVLPLVRTKRFVVPQRLRWREEDGFFLVSVRGAAVYDLGPTTARYLQDLQKTGDSFDVGAFPGTDLELCRLLELWIVETSDGATTEPVSTAFVNSAHANLDPETAEKMIAL